MKTLILSISFLFATCLSAQHLPKPILNSKQQSVSGSVYETQHKTKILGRSEPFRLDSYNIWVWNTGQEQWELNLRNLYSYNAAGLQEVADLFVDQFGAWNNISRDSFFYDDEGRIIRTGSYGWDGNAWMAFSQFYQSYGPQTSQSILQVWTGNEWFNQFRIDYVYDANELVISESFSTWEGSDWEVISRRLYSYNAQSLLDTIFEQDLEQGVWEDVERWIYTYDAQGRNVTFLRQEYIGGVWENVVRETISYENGIRTTIGEEWVADQWEIVYKSDVLLEDERIIYITNSAWDGLEWIKSDSVHYYYSDLSAVDRPVNENSLINMYPNPVRDILILEAKKIANTNSFVEIIAMTGEHVYLHETLSSNKHEIDVSHLPSGIYFVRIKSGSRMESVKFIKL